MQDDSSWGMTWQAQRQAENGWKWAERWVQPQKQSNYRYHVGGAARGLCQEKQRWADGDEDGRSTAALQHCRWAPIYWVSHMDVGTTTAVARRR
jgi:hypothetical protein